MPSRSTWSTLCATPLLAAALFACGAAKDSSATDSGTSGGSSGSGGEAGVGAQVEGGSTGQSAGGVGEAEGGEAGVGLGGNAGAGDGGDAGSAAAGNDGGSAGASDGGAAGMGGAAAPGPFDCVGMPLPVDAPPSIAISGVVTEPTADGPSPIAGANVAALSADGLATLATTSTDEQGSYALELQTGGAPLSSLLRFSADGFVDTVVYPALPLTAPALTVDAPFYSNEVLDLFAGLGGTTRDPDAGLIQVLVLDCFGNPVEGASLTTDPPGDVRYVSTSGVPGALATVTSALGLSMIFNLPPGDVTLRASVGSVQLRSHALSSAAGRVAITEIVP